MMSGAKVFVPDLDTDFYAQSVLEILKTFEIRFVYNRVATSKLNISVKEVLVIRFITCLVYWNPNISATLFKTNFLI